MSDTHTKPFSIVRERPIKVAVVAFNGISPFHLAIPGVVFAEASVDAHSPRFEVKVCAAEPQPLLTSAGYRIDGLRDLTWLRRADWVIVPTWRDIEKAPPATLTRALQSARGRGAFVVGLCLGVYVLAHAGLLNGRRATTHWAYAGSLAERFPQVQLEVDALYIEDQGVMTSAGTTAALDACLQLVRRTQGQEWAHRVARQLVMAPHRDGGQAQYLVCPLPQNPRDERFVRLLEHLRQRLDQAHTLDDLAQRMHMSRRHFSRHFKAQTGASLGHWLLHERLQRAQQLLESSRHSVERVAQACGMGSPENLRHHFRKAFRISPSSWRQRFQT